MRLSVYACMCTPPEHVRARAHMRRVRAHLSLPCALWLVLYFYMLVRKYACIHYQGLVSYSTGKGIMVQAYSPLGGDAHAALLGSTVLKTIAAAHNKSTAQVALRWVLQQGYALATSTVEKPYMVEDLGAFGWELTADEMVYIDHLNVAPDDPVKSMCLL